MYLTLLKTTVVQALRKSFASTPTADFANLLVDIEYPISPQSYPSVWVNYDDNDSLQIISIDHTEFVADEQGSLHEITRWTFSGTVTLTPVAMSSRERDALYDELVRIYAFSKLEGDASPFRDLIENNELLRVIVNWDKLRPGGDASAPGTPWGTDDEVIYEKSLSFDVEGEFLSDPSKNTLLPLSAVIVVGTQIDPEGNPTGVTQTVVVNAASAAASAAVQALGIEVDPEGWQ